MRAYKFDLAKLPAAVSSSSLHDRIASVLGTAPDSVVVDEGRGTLTVHMLSPVSNGQRRTLNALVRAEAVPPPTATGQFLYSHDGMSWCESAFVINDDGLILFGDDDQVVVVGA